MKHRATNSLPYRLGRHIRRTKCMLLHRRGDGVHSPYAFRLIRQVLRNPHPYAAFEELGGLHRERKRQLRQTAGHRAITSKRFLEVIFRLSADRGAEAVGLFSARESLVAAYIQRAVPNAHIAEYHDTASPRSTPTLELEDAELIVLEDATAEELERIIRAIRSKPKTKQPRILVLNTYNPVLRHQAKSLCIQLKPGVQFDLKGLEIWVWRTGITPGRYSVYC